MNSSNQLIILDIQEKERSRIASELHDSSLQSLTHLVHTIELSAMYIDKDPISAKLELETCSKDLKKVIAEIRDTIFNLRPMTFDDLGFRECVENNIDDLKRQFKSSEIVADIDDISFSQDKEINNLYLVTLYRIIQEALMNALKHAKAEKVILHIKESDKQIKVEIIDNGVGFSIDQMTDSESKHFGIAIMKERTCLLNGKINIVSKINKGTQVEIIVPK